MDKFLEIVYASQLADADEGDEFMKIFAPLLSRLEELLSTQIYSEIEELFTDCAIENNRFYGVEGMKLAIGIMDGSHVTII